MLMYNCTLTCTIVQLYKLSSLAGTKAGWPASYNNMVPPILNCHHLAAIVTLLMINLPWWTHSELKRIDFHTDSAT